MPVCDDTFKGRGLCWGADPELFFPRVGTKGIPAKIAEAKRICGLCPVKALCLEWALSRREPTGVWGGTTVRERHEMLKAAGEPRQPKRPRPPRTHCLSGRHIYNDQTTSIDPKGRRTCRLCRADSATAREAKRAELAAAAKAASQTALVLAA